MNIQIITSSYPAFPDDPSGAAGLFVRAFALELRKQGHLVVIQPVARKEHYSPEDGLVIEPLPWRGGDRELASLNLYSPRNWIVIWNFFRRARPKVRQVHVRYKIDRTLCMWAVPAGLLGYWLKARLNKPYDVWVLGSDLWKIRKIPLLGGALQKKILGRADRVFADGIGLCRDVETIARRHCEFLPSSRVLPVASDEDGDKQASEYVNLLFVGRYHHNKGPDLLLEAFKKVSCPEKARLRLRMYGIGPLKLSLLAFVEQHKLGVCVTVNDGINAQELARELSRSDYLVIPSRIESIPVVFSDALQMGTPVIATPAGDLPDLIREHGCGILADGFSPQALARAIETACCRHKKTDFSDNALLLWQRFSVSDAVNKWLTADPGCAVEKSG